MKRLNKKLKRLQRKLSRKYNKLKNDKTFIKGEKIIKTENIIKLEKQIRIVYLRIHNIRLNHIHQTTNSIVKTKPYRIIVKDLNVKGMVKNKHLSKAISERCFNMFQSILKYKCEWNGIEFVKADHIIQVQKCVVVVEI